MFDPLARRVRAFRSFARVLGLGQTLRFYLDRARKRPSAMLKVRGMRFPVCYRPATSDSHALFSVFCDRDCDPPLPHPPAFIIDGGTNVGYASILLANKYPEAAILAVEPDAANFDMAQENCRPYPNIRLLRGGIWKNCDPLVIANPNAESHSFQLGEAVGVSAESVPGFTVQALLREAGRATVDLLKLDIEGAEEGVFSSSEWLDHVGVVAVEIHNDSAEKTILQALLSRNFTCSRKGEKWILTNENAQIPLAG